MSFYHAYIVFDYISRLSKRTRLNIDSSTTEWPAKILRPETTVKHTLTADWRRNNMDNGRVSLLRDNGKCSLVVKGVKVQGDLFHLWHMKNITASLKYD